MDIVELKGVNPKMLAGCTSSATNLATDLTARTSSPESERKARRRNQAYCEFDIMSVYHARKKQQRAGKSRHAKERAKHPSGERCKELALPSKLEKVEKSELSKKIDDLTARNEKIKQLLVVNVKQQHADDRHDGGGGSGNLDGHRRHREHKSRRSARCCPHDDSEVTKTTTKDTTESTRMTATTTTPESLEAKSKHRSRRERNPAFAEDDSKMAAGHHGKITVRLKTGGVKQEDGKVPDSKSQLIRVTNYEKKSKSMDRRPEKRHDRNDIITVYENQHILEETDSLMSRDTMRKSKTHARSSSRTRERDSTAPRQAAILEHPSVKSEPTKEKEKTETGSKIPKNREQNQGIAEELKAIYEPTKSIKALRHKSPSPSKTVTPRKELSFSNLNLRPNINHYTSPVQIATTQTSVSRIETPGFGSLGLGVHSSLLEDINQAFAKSKLDELKRINNSGKPAPSVITSGSPEVLSQTAIALRDIMKVHELEQKYHLQNNATKCKCKFVEKAAFLSDGCQSPKATAKTPFAKNSKFRKTRCDTSDRIVEIASKTCRDQKVTFSVEGVEPPRKLKSDSDNENYKSLKMENVFNLQVFPGITITQNNLKQSDLNLLCHGGEKPKRLLDESLGALNGSECLYPFRGSVDNTQSEFKRKESCDVSYKFKKRYWSSKELPKRKCKDKKKRKPKVLKRDASVQAGGDLEVEASERDIGVSTDCHPSAARTSRDAQVQFSFPQAAQALSTLTRTYPLQSRRTSRSDSNLTIYREEYLRKTEYLECKEVQAIPEQKSSPKPHKVVKPLPNMSIPKQPKQDVPTNSGARDLVQTKCYRDSPCHTPRKLRPNHRSRKCPSRSKEYLDPRNCQPVRSTGSIRQVPHYTKKTRSKSLNLDRDSLVEKININKETIKHHHQEIAALEKCLNEILHRLVQDDSLSKVTLRGEKIIDSANSSSGSQPNTQEENEEPSVESSGSVPEQGKKKRDREKRPRVKSKVTMTMSKFHRGKAYGENLKRRSRRAKERAKDQGQRKCDNDHDQGCVSPVKVRSVYKNPRGFVSSATSLSSKISDLGSTSPYPQSIPSLNIGFSATRRSSSSDDQDEPPQKGHGQHHQGIVKKKHKLYPKEVNYSKKKTKSIYDMLLQYINLTNDDGDGDDAESPTHENLLENESRIVILSVSSLKLKRPRPQKLRKKLSTPDDQSDSDPLVEYTDKIRAAGVKTPFFMGKRLEGNLTQNVHKTTKPPKPKLSSEDSLEYNTTSHTPDLCPLTAIFNFEPPKRDFLVYNTEVFSPNKPKIEFKPQSTSLPSTSTSQDSTRNSVVSEPSTSHKLMTIIEEKVADPTARARSPSPKPKPKPRDDPEWTVADLSPVLSRRAYPTYDDCIKCLESMDEEDKPKPKLTSFNCNDRECSNLIFNYTSKKDAHQSKESSRFNSKAESSAYHTLTTIMDSKSGSFHSPSECDTQIKNESGYESSKKSSTFMNFFKKRALLEKFKSKVKKKALECGPSVSETLALTDKRSPACIISQESIEEQMSDEEPSEQERSPFAEGKTVLWFNFRKKKREAGFGCDPSCRNKREPSNPYEIPPGCSGTCHKATKCMSTNTWKSFLSPLKTECPCSQPFEKQREQCKKYASKVLMEAAQRQKGYERQYAQFEEMPLNVLMGTNKCPCEKMRQGCAKTYANKTAGIQVKQEQKSAPVQVKRSPLPSVHDELPVAGVPPPPTARVSRHAEPIPRRSEHESEEEYQQRLSLVAPAESEVEVVAPEEPAADDVSSIRSFTDKEIFDRLLHDYERKDLIAERLSSDEQFYHDQLDAANSGVSPDLQVQHRAERQEEERVRGPRFSDRPKPLVHIAADTTVRPDDIGTCFARGFRPDNLMLSGDACFHINKQDKVKMSPYMLKNTESIIDFSERETPLDFLLALGFMVDEASNALKDDDIRSRLLAAITEGCASEARVWINKITTTQGTLLYLVAYKARPETMRYFLQLVEAIINRRINNAIRLDGFLRVLEDVEAGRVQMINILGQDKFEDEENEEKIVKKQLKSLFITVYTVAEKEASVTGRTLSANQISLLRILVAKYRAGLHPHLELIARYIGQGLLENEIQLEAAMIFLSRLDTAEVKLKEFENYCGITCQLQDT